VTARASGVPHHVCRVPHALTLDPDTGMPHRHAHTIPAFSFGSDQ
jgi:hypothetical protein